MKKNDIKDILSLKLKVIDNIIDHLPNTAKEKINDLQNNFFTAINEVSKEYIENKKPDKDNKNIKSVTIE